MRKYIDNLVLTMSLVIALFLIAWAASDVTGKTVIKKRVSFDDCKVISDVGYNTVYSCPEGIVYVVKKK